MKKIFIVITLFMMSSMLIAQDAMFSTPYIQLPNPQTRGGMPLYEALFRRSTAREFSTAKLSLQQISDLLWCANGINRNDGKRTAPSARNAQEIDIYVMMPDGAYFYDVEKNQLTLVSDKDLRPVTSHSDFAKQAPLMLLFVANYDKMKGFDENGREFYGATDAGYVSQNVYLYCAANKMNTVVMGHIYRDDIKAALQFNGKAVLAQCVGFPVE
ncbi:MAG: SagB/ThcOx family dehydrogenase [Bacteroidales bacterium]|nr:SagB/ThcOx family dehydrogenase [Bacteroidales bacterium]